jgi:hypothetical protein
VANVSHFGIFQSDLIIRSAITEALADIRKNMWLFDFIFIDLLQDSLTSKAHGAKEILEAKKWFQKTEVPVLTNVGMNPPQFPAITIALVDSNEAETTVGDVHHDPFDDQATDPDVVKFTPASYVASTGVMKLPPEISEVFTIVPGMAIADTGGKRHEIVEVVDDATLKLAPGTVANFNTAALRYRLPAYQMAIESVSMKESFLLGVHVQGPPFYLTVLHNIIVFALLRYKQSLLEARGFERSVFNSTDFSRNQTFNEEGVYTRFVTLTGYVRQSWPKAVTQTIQTLKPSFTVKDEPTATTLVWGSDEDDE